MASKLSKTRGAFERANRETAAIVLAGPERYPAGSLMAIWAELILNPPAEHTRPETGRAA